MTKADPSLRARSARALRMTHAERPEKEKKKE